MLNPTTEKVYIGLSVSRFVVVGSIPGEVDFFSFLQGSSQIEMCLLDTLLELDSQGSGRMDHDQIGF